MTTASTAHRGPFVLPGTDSEGLPRAVACYWHGAHYDGETCDRPPAPDRPQPITGGYGVFPPAASPPSPPTPTQEPRTP